MTAMIINFADYLQKKSVEKKVPSQVECDKPLKAANQTKTNKKKRSIVMLTDEEWEQFCQLEFPEEVLEDDDGFIYLPDPEQHEILEKFLHYFGFSYEEFAKSLDDLHDFWVVLRWDYLKLANLYVNRRRWLRNQKGALCSEEEFDYIEVVATGDRERQKELRSCVFKSVEQRRIWLAKAEGM